MTKFKLIGAAALSIVLAGPAMAYDGYRARGPYTQAFRGYHDMRAQDALHFGRMDIYPRYHSGWGGPYGTITPARSMTIWVPRIGDVGELTIRLKRA